MEKTINLLKKVKLTLQPFAQLIGKSSFWKIAFICFLLRILVKQPFGALLALIIGCIWIWRNVSIVKEFFYKIQVWILCKFSGSENKSLWFENEGREKIRVLVHRLSSQGVNYCNLTEEISLPPMSHWFAIERGLKEMGIISQISDKFFYLSWHLQNQTETSNQSSNS